MFWFYQHLNKKKEERKREVSRRKKEKIKKEKKLENKDTLAIPKCLIELLVNLLTVI